MEWGWTPLAIKKPLNTTTTCPPSAKLSIDGFLTFIPIHQNGPGLRNLPPHKAQVLEAIDYVKHLPDVNPARIALTNNSRGGLLTLIMNIKQPNLKMLIIMAPT